MKGWQPAHGHGANAGNDGGTTMVTEYHRGRAAFTCGFGPGHLAHPIHTLALASLPPVFVRIGNVQSGVITVIHEDGTRSDWWHHDWRAVNDAIGTSDGIAFLHAGAVLRIGGRLVSVSRTPSPCDDGTAHLDPHHPAWAGPPVGPAVDPVWQWPNVSHNRHYEPGHHLPFWRLEHALAKGPGVVVEDIRAGGGDVGFTVHGERLRRYHHNTSRIHDAILEATEGTPYRVPAGAHRTPPDPNRRWGDTEFGDAPVASLLDDEVLRVGDCYFWLGRSTDRGPNTCGYQAGVQTQFLRQRNEAMFHRTQFLPAPLEPAFITEILRKEADRHVPWHDRREPAGSEVSDAQTGFVVPVGDDDLTTEEGRAALARRIAAAAGPSIEGHVWSGHTGTALYGPEIVQ